MKSTIFIAILLAVVGIFATASKSNPDVNTTTGDELVWHTDLMKAQDISVATKKPIFGFFTGSDWCGWCRKIQADVFAKEEFKKWAKENVVLLELDFPRSKQLPTELAQQNQGLQQAFKVSGYPTIWMFYLTKDTTNNQLNISALGSLGYPAGSETGKEQVKFLTDANAILANGKK
jgi:thioredoxin-related protein